MKHISRLCAFLILAASTLAQIQTATLGESNPKTPEVSTEELRRALEEKSATVFDVRPSLEFAISHIPGSVNVAQKTGTSKALYISDAAEVERVVGGKKSTPVILYCNGPFCGKSKRVAEDLLAAGFTNVRRYQLGIPVWRALGGLTQIEPEGVRNVFQNDHTSVWLDTRSLEDVKKGSLSGAKHIGVEVTQGGKDNPAMQQAKNDGTLPIDDHNTRIIVFGDDPKLVRAISDAVAREAFHNVAFYAGTYAELSNASK
ncbi:MAG TPA: rhodanese-like domain-containing protein [Terriglobales bacterium]|jgi:rhodanese-related sulfurtransferase|nr:rhodanese-like domain-containing protein [Terriglobales bacterium]